MKLEEVKNITFPAASMEEWGAKAEESLKGRSIESLSKRTYERIKLKPLYSREDINTSKLSGYPGESDYRRGINASGYQGNSWHVANKVGYKSIDDLEVNVHKAFASGQTALAFEVDSMLFSDMEKLRGLIGKYSSLAPFSIMADGFLKPFLEAAAQTTSNSDSKASGFIAADPIALAAKAGGFKEGEDAIFVEWEQALRVADATLPQVRTVLINTAPYHNAGANALQELGIALATGVFYIQRLLGQGWELESAMQKLVFHFSIGGNFFMETAKLRAARMLWDKVAEAYGAGREARKMVISAETSHFTKTISDPYVNLLRAGNEAFAAVLGGVQYLSVSTLDAAAGRSTAFSERIARNTQLILKEEALLEKVTDPSGGSWYIESLTQELVQKSWDCFLQIEEQKGILNALKSNWIQDNIAEVRAERERDVFTRKQSIIGSNVYANIAEQAEEYISKVQEIGAFNPLPAARLSQPYEELRFKAASLEESTGLKPAVGLICLGDLKRHKTRADFVVSFMAAGGVGTHKSAGIENVAAALDFISASDLRHFCLCGDDQQYSELALGLAREIGVHYPGCSLALAGFPGEQERQALSQAGIKSYYHVKGNQYEALSNLLSEIEVAIYGQET